MADRVTITRREKNPDGSTTLYGIDDDGHHVCCTFPAGSTLEVIVCGECSARLTGGMCPNCVTPEQITGGAE